jgi:hypothetical protein
MSDGWTSEGQQGGARGADGAAAPAGRSERWLDGVERIVEERLFGFGEGAGARLRAAAERLVQAARTRPLATIALAVGVGYVAGRLAGLRARLLPV